MSKARIARFERHDWMQSLAVVFFDKVSFYAGKGDSWGIGIEVSFYERSLTFRLFNLYMGVEVWFSE